MPVDGDPDHRTVSLPMRAPAGPRGVRLEHRRAVAGFGATTTREQTRQTRSRPADRCRRPTPRRQINLHTDACGSKHASAIVTATPPSAQSCADAISRCQPA
jgi:hypothetical protein